MTTILHKHQHHLLTGCAIVTLAGVLALASRPALAGCNSGSVANATLLSSAGCQANAAGTSATAVGAGASAAVLNSTAFGTNAVAGGTGSVAIGGDSTTSNAANAAGATSVAVGNFSDALGSGGWRRCRRCRLRGRRL
jgi:hypothetical protein